MADPNLFDTDVAVGQSDEEEDFDEEGEPAQRRKNNNANGLDDSSEEEDEDDDEEAQRQVREGFIVDEDEDDDEGLEARAERRRLKKKRRREEREEEEMLDEEDLDLIGETLPDERRQDKESKFKRLKRGHREDRQTSEARGVEDIFSDEEEGDVGAGRGRGAFGYGDEMEDFIEEDDFMDGEADKMRDELEVRRPARGGYSDLQHMKDSGLDEADIEDMRGAFGDGNEFEWALDVEQAHVDEQQGDPDKPLELKDVFEPSQLVEKMLTEEDNEIRQEDVPERFQIARKPFPKLTDLPEDEQAALAQEEAKWISNLMAPKKRIASHLRQPYEAAVAKVLELMNVEDYEPPFIFSQRKDYLIHTTPGREGEQTADKLLSQSDLWEVFEHDLKFRAYVEKRSAIQRSIAILKEANGEDWKDVVFDDMIPSADTLEELQDIQDYLNFQYSAQLKDAKGAEAEQNGHFKRAGGATSMWDKTRSGPAYHVVRAFGITADAFAVNAQKTGHRTYTEDTDKRPDDLADTLIQEPEFKTGQDVLKAAKAMFVEELVMSPRMRKVLRGRYFQGVVFDVHRTEKGLKVIDEEHPWYEFKYLRNQDIHAFVDRPELFLRMLKAEHDGLVEVRIRLQGESKLREELQRSIESDNFSEVADAWNVFRKEALEAALKKLNKIMTKSVKESIKSECESQIAKLCREAYSTKLDQAPFKPKGMILGTSPRVLALTNGSGARDHAIFWAYIEENGRCLENGKFEDLRLGNADKYVSQGKDVDALVELVDRRKPDVIAVGGMSVETRKLYKDLQDIVEKHDLRGNTYEDDEDRETSDPLEVMIANDEVARLYHESERAAIEHAGLPKWTRYAIAMAKYLQSPMKEYAALGRDITSIRFDPNQGLIPEDKLIKVLEMAMVDMVNMVGIEINEAISDSYTASLLPYVCGLGARKAAQLIKVINMNGGEVGSREELIGDMERNIRPALGPKVWTNCASFLYITYEEAEQGADYLDNTRIHPEDYDLARKIAADALELDEEDVKGMVDEEGPAAVLRKLVKDEATHKVEDLVLEEYAEQLEKNFGQRKRATLETIRVELGNPYEELRRQFEYLHADDIFTMLTGETRESLQEGMIVPVVVRRTFADHVEVRLDCGIEGGISETEYPEEMISNRMEARAMWSPQTIIRAKLTFINRKQLTAQLTLRDNELRTPFKRQFGHGLDEWDSELEARDKKEARKAMAKADGGRAQRVIKHPLFRPFNGQQAEQFLASAGRGDCVIRPSSKGLDHLTVTWKVHDGLYQHIDVLELDKENEFSVGRTLRIGGKYNYSDLDELIVLHVQAMAKKVDEMMGDEKYQRGSKTDTEQYLTVYTEANPRRSMYAFCLNSQYPGYFFLCFKAGQNAPHANWPVKVIPNAFELRKNPYPDMRALKNGFKTLINPQVNGGATNGAGMNGRK
ncbi:transcription elongation factor spt6 [Polychaeton citri CBS 116435]|uniref:Transcription elongation factor Spt6 n=1 Tax=Polychaeton citri CBS 116435 TaxID=1314669 RepID=A0A9P4QHC7_9PEZI|nr:transcription elongation factor spt6 [Polychaeton citri CBS 116435]